MTYGPVWLREKGGEGGKESGSKGKAAGLDIGAFHSFFFQMLWQGADV